jgi:hypothetical protein
LNSKVSSEEFSGKNVSGILLVLFEPNSLLIPVTNQVETNDSTYKYKVFVIVGDIPGKLVYVGTVRSGF